MALNKLGLAIKATGAMKVWKDGSGVSFIWRWWHPLSWIICPIILIASVLLTGIAGTWQDRAYLGFAIKPYWKARLTQREFI